MKRTFLIRKLVYALFFVSYCLLICLSIQGCVISDSKENGKQKPAHEDSLTLSKQVEDKTTLSYPDQTIISDLISQANSSDLQGKNLDWLNINTGNRGVISALTEIKNDQGMPCRLFQATRESFDGVQLFEGKTCEISDDIWKLIDIKSF